MAIQFKCMACDTVVKAKEKYVGQIGKCPVCGMKMKVPIPEAEIVPDDKLPSSEAKEIVETVDFEPLSEAKASNFDETGDS